MNLQESHDALAYELRQLIKCIRDGELVDYSPLMDEIFDSEHALEQAETFMQRNRVR